jgi:surface protein
MWRGGARPFNQNLNSWNVSQVTIMDSAFGYCNNFNQPLDNWNVSNVSNTRAMFVGCSSFNQDIGGWNTISLTNPQQMFESASSFNQDLGSWDVSGVPSFDRMFRFASSFNNGNSPNINNWNVTGTNIFQNMFSGCTSFNQPLNNWDVSNATVFNSMFNACSIFNQDITGWNTGNVIDMRNMFATTGAFNQNISSWDVSKVTRFDGMFNNADAFNQPIGSWTLNTISPVNMTSMFQNTELFDQDLGAWNTSQVTTMTSMFQNAKGFNNGGSPNINNWDTSNVTAMNSMFYMGSVAQADQSFNQPIGNWNTSNVTDMSGMFYGNLVFDQPIGTWDTSNVTNMNVMFYITIIDQDLSNWNIGSITPNSANFNWLKRANYGIPFSTANYDAMLVSYEAQVPPVGLVWDIGDATYTLGGEAEAARTSLISTYGWTITDGGGIVARNTRIGGMSATLNTSANIASALGLTEPDITNVLVDNNDVLFDVGTTYSLPGTFKQNTTITAFDDRNGNVTSQAAQIFRSCTSLTYLNLPGLTTLGDFSFEGLTSLVRADLINCTNIGTGNNFKLGTPDSAILTVALSSLTSDADGGPQANLRSLTCVVNYDGYVDDGTWNTEITGISAVENTRELLASRLGCGTAALLNFQINGSDVRAKIYGNYTINGYAFNGRTDITDYRDNDNKVTDLAPHCFGFTTNYLNAVFNGITTLVANNQFRNSAIDTIRMNSLTTISGTYLVRDTAVLQLFFPALINWNTNALFYANGNITNIEAPSLQTLGTTTGNDFAIGSNLAIGGTVTVSDFLQTSNAGQPDGDLTWLIANRSANVVYAAQPYTTDLVASYDFDINFTDYTGNNPLTPSGTTPPVAGVAGGIVSNCAEFNSSGDYTLAADSNDFSFTDGVNDLPFSVSFWANFTGYNASGSGGAWFLSKRDTSTNEEYQIMSYQNELAFVLFSGGGSTNFLNARIAYPPPIGSWHHYTFTYDGSATFAGLKIYIDGVSQSLTNNSSGTYTGMINGTQDVNIGSRSWQPSAGSFHGKMDEYHIWKNRELTPAEVTDIYNTENAGNSILPPDYTTNLVASYNFDTNFTDYTGTHNATLGAATVTAGSPGGVVSNCADFDGVNGFLNVLNSVDFSMTDGISDVPYSVSFWVKPQNKTTNQWFINRWGSSGQKEWIIVINVSGELTFLLSDGNAVNYIRTDYAWVPTLSTWYHLAFTYDGSALDTGLKIYINGSIVPSIPSTVGTYAGTTQTLVNTIIGENVSSSSQNFDGQMDELHLWKNRELTAAEVTDIYNKENAGNSILP